MNLTLATVLAATQAEVVRARGDSEVRNDLGLADLERVLSGVSIDSREVQRDGLFVALRGERVDGHQFVPAALAAGAGAALVSHLPDLLPPMGHRQYLLLVPDPAAALRQLARYWRRQHQAEVIGVTGSIGKTTTKEIVAGILGAAMPVLKSEANLNTEIGLPLTVLQLDDQHRAAVLEMGMYAVGDIALLAETAEPRIGIVTNVAPIHLERVGSIERIARTKSELPAALPPDGLAVLNADNRWTRAMAVTSSVARIATVGLAEDSTYRAVDLVADGLEGFSFTLLAGDKRLPLRTRVPGTHNVHAFLAAVAVAREMGMDWEAIRQAVADVTLAARQHIIRGRDGTVLIDDSYNAAPMSVHAALDLLAASPGTKIAVLGDMLELGPGEEDSHRQIGARAAEVADWLVVRGPRSVWIAEAAEGHGFRPDRVIRTTSNAEAAGAVRDIMLPGGAGRWAILVKGSRGMAMEEVVQSLREAL